MRPTRLILRDASKWPLLRMRAGDRSALIPSALRRPTRPARHHQRQRKADGARAQQRAERVVLHLFRHGLRTVAESVAAVLIGVLGVTGGGISSVTRGVLGLAVQILHRACGLTRSEER